MLCLPQIPLALLARGAASEALRGLAVRETRRARCHLDLLAFAAFAEDAGERAEREAVAETCRKCAAERPGSAGPRRTFDTLALDVRGLRRSSDARLSLAPFVLPLATAVQSVEADGGREKSDREGPLAEVEWERDVCAFVSVCDEEAEWGVWGFVVSSMSPVAKLGSQLAMAASR